MCTHTHLCLYIYVYNHENDVNSRVRDGLIQTNTHPRWGHQNIRHLHTQALRNHDIIIHCSVYIYIIYTYVRVLAGSRNIIVYSYV